MDNKDFLHLSLEDREKISAYLSLQGVLKKTKKSLWRFFLELIIVLFALAGFGFLAAFWGVKLHLTNTSGIIDRQTEAFWEGGKEAPSKFSLYRKGSGYTFFTKENYCSLKSLQKDFPGTFFRILNLALSNKAELAQNNLNVAIKNLSMVSASAPFCDFVFSTNITKADFESLAHVIDSKNLFLFTDSPEWDFFKNGVLKDADVIRRVEGETGIKGRVLVSELVAEQLRLFYSDRAWFEEAIAPVKVLVSMSQFSWGVLGIKQETALTIEKNLKAPDSAFYLGSEYENKLDFQTENVDSERFQRITDYHDHYYAYLYTALYNKEIIAQWKKEGVDISNRPEILATLYNIGFNHSVPNTDPQMGGAELTIAGNKYSFGRLAYDFYYSGEMLEEFPQ